MGLILDSSVVIAAVSNSAALGAGCGQGCPEHPRESMRRRVLVVEERRRRRPERSGRRAAGRPRSPGDEGIPLFGLDDRARVLQTGMKVIAGQSGIVPQYLFLRRSTISSTASRVPRMTGFPTRICGSTMMRSCQVIRCSSRWLPIILPRGRPRDHCRLQTAD